MARSDMLSRALGAALAVLACAVFGAQQVRAREVLEDTAVPSSATAGTNADIYGRWRIVKVLGSADIAAMSDRQARALIGKVADIGEHAFVFNGETCESPTYERSRDDLAKSFREQGHASAFGFGLPDPVTSIDADCTQLFLKKPGVIVILWGGFYFDAVRQKH